MLSALGSTLALAWFAPIASCARRLLAWACLSVFAALIAAAVFLAFQSATIGTSIADTPVVLAQTQFGHILATRCALLLTAGVALAVRQPWLAVLFAAAAAATQAGHDHAWAMADGPSLLAASNAAHILAAGAWLGGLVPLLIVVSAVAPHEAGRACQDFARLGTACVAIIASTALIQASTLAGSLTGLLTTAYGWTLLAKLAFFLALLTLAAINRFRLVPGLSANPMTIQRLIRNIVAETVLGLATITAAALLTSLPPAMAM